jgi:hypothetical protein
MPIYHYLTGKRNVVRTEYLCAWREPDGKVESKWMTEEEMNANPFKYVPVEDENHKPKTRDREVEERDTTAVQMVNDKGATFIISQLALFYNDKILFANISRDEAAFMAGDSVDRAFSYIIFNEEEYEVKDTTRLITYAANLMESLYSFLTSLLNGETREALVAIYGGGYKVEKKEGEQAEPMQSPVRWPFGKK